MNNKSFNVTVNLMLDRKVWRKMGYGDQPSKAEVFDLFGSFVDGIVLPTSKNPMTIRYMGAPGHYYITVGVTVAVPWWRRAGFGDTVSQKEVQTVFDDFVARVSSNYIVTVVPA